jgi:hypothetical protein
MSKVNRESVSWMIAATMAIISAVVGYVAYHANYATKKEVDSGVAAVFLFLKSQNQNIKNHYLKNLNKGVLVDESEKQLERLEYEEQYINNVQQALGVLPEPAE